eukprot:scaffold33321_cov60-Phaeocystis_antarctica.AAC.2
MAPATDGAVSARGRVPAASRGGGPPGSPCGSGAWRPCTRPCRRSVSLRSMCTVVCTAWT